MHVTIANALAQLQQQDSPFLEVFTHGTLSVEIYQPHKVDLQTPHSRDEVYVVFSGSGTFYHDGDRMPFKAGDFLFAKAGIEHRFEDFTDDFVVWVFFYGPEGGEQG